MNNLGDKKIWQTSERTIEYSDKTLVMAILNVTPDSFSDGGKYNAVDASLIQVEKFIRDGADIVDIGGESTRPNAKKVTIDEEIIRVEPIIKAIKKRFDVPISIDTSKSNVAEIAFNAGAEIINDVSGLKFDENIAEIAAKYKTGLILMHLRGSFETMHKQEPVGDIIKEVSNCFDRSIKKAKEFGVLEKQICLDIGIGFSKTFTQNLELLGKIDKLCKEFMNYPLLVGTSRKSFIGKILNDAPTQKRINGTIATNVLSVWNGANIVRVHDVFEIVEALRVVDAIKREL